MFLKFFLSLLLVVAAPFVKAAEVHWEIMFPWVVPAQHPGNEWAVDSIANNIIGQIHYPHWDGRINLGGNLSDLNEEQLVQLAERIFEACGSRIAFSQPFQWPELRLEQVELAIEGFFDPELRKKIFEVNFSAMMMRGEKRNAQASAGMSLGQAWAALKDFIEHYRKGLGEAEFLLENIPL